MPEIFPSPAPPDPAPVDVCVVGAGLAGRLIAGRLRDLGISCALLDPSPSPRDPARLALPCPPEHPHRLIAALGEDRARALVDFLAAHRRASGGSPAPLRLIPHRTEGAEMAASLEAALTLGLDARPAPGGVEQAGYTLHDAALIPDPPDLPVQPGDLPPCEITVLCPDWQPLDPFLADKLLPVREVLLPLPALLPPLAAWHFSLRWSPASVGGATITVASGAREASPHLEAGETDPSPSPRVAAALDRISRSLLPAHPPGPPEAFITGHACDNLPIVGPVPGRPTTLLCTGFGYAAATWAPACAAALVEGLLTGRPGDLPRELSTYRFC